MQHSWKPAEKVVYSALATLFSVSFHQSTCWPLILDPDNELKPWIKILAEAVAKEKELSEERFATGCYLGIGIVLVHANAVADTPFTPNLNDGRESFDVSDSKFILTI